MYRVRELSRSHKIFSFFAAKKKFADGSEIEMYSVAAKNDTQRVLSHVRIIYFKTKINVYHMLFKHDICTFILYFSMFFFLSLGCVIRITCRIFYRHADVDDVSPINRLGS